MNQINILRRISILKVLKFTQCVLQVFLLVLLIFISFQDVSANEDYASDQLMIKYKKGGNSSNVKARLAERGIPGGKNIPEIGVEVIDVAPDELEALQEELSQDPDVEYVEKNYYYEPLAIPNDPLFSDQLYFDVFQALQAWDIETGDPDVVIAVVDSGLDLTHEDLQGGKVLPGCNVFGETFDHNNCDPDVTDIAAHGSGVTGTAAADTDNNVGVAGVCWGCSILPIKVTSPSNTYATSETIEGILFAANYAQNNPTKRVVINMSFGRPCGGPTQAEQDAIDFAWDNGAILVSARGNTGDTTPYCPAIADNVIAVSGTNLDDTLWSSSSWNQVDLVAPAVPIYNIAPGDLIDPPYIPTWGGTSFSAAIVSGVAGLAWSANMSMSNWQLNQILINSADNIGDTVFFGNGRINANSAVLQAPNPPPNPTPTPSPTPVPTPDPNELFLGNSGGVGIVTGKGKAFAQVTNAEPGSVLYLMWSTAVDDNGGSVLGGSGPCAGEIIRLVDATKITRARADENGRATFNFNIGGKQQGNSFITQAYSHSKASVCRKSKTRNVTIPIP